MYKTERHRFGLWVVFVSLVTLSLACSSSKAVKTSPQTEAQITGFEKMDESFEPRAVLDYDIAIEDLASTSDPQDEYVFSQPTLEDSVGIGYRVQLVQTADPEEAKNVQRDAIFRFEEEVYRIFNAPFYKVRIGDLINWNDAEKLQKLAIQKGFKEAWIIQTQINLKKAYQWMEDL